MNRANRIFALISFVLGIAITILSKSTNETLSKFDVGSGAFPMLCGILLIFLSIVLFLTNLKNTDSRTVDFGGIWALVYFVIIFLYILLLRPLGFIVDSLWIVPVMMYILGQRKPVTIILGTVLSVAAIYIAFRYGFNVVLPKGILNGIL